MNQQSNAGVRSPRVRSWWQELDDGEFLEELHDMTVLELEDLALEINAAVTAAGTVACDESKDPAWRLRARNAVPWMKKKRALLGSHLNRVHSAKKKSKDEFRHAVVDDARSMARAGNYEGAILRLLDWVEDFGKTGTGQLAGDPPKGEAT